MLRRYPRTMIGALALAAVGLAAAFAAAQTAPSRVDPLRSASTALVKPNALFVIDLSASMQCDLQASFWPDGVDERVFGTSDKRTCVDQMGIPTGVRTGKFFNNDASYLEHPVVADDFAISSWELEYNSREDGSSGGGGGGDPPAGTGGLCAVGSPYLFFDGNKVEWLLVNDVDQDRMIASVEVTWPAANKKLKKLKLEGKEFYDKAKEPPSAFVDSEFKGNESDRTIQAGDSKTLRLEFESNAVPDTSAYLITVIFDDGCTLSFDPTPPDPGGEPACIDVPAGSCSSQPCALCQGGGVFTNGSFRWRWHDASRTSVVKNLLGNSVPIETLDAPMTLDDGPTPWISADDECLPIKPDRLPVRRAEPVGLVDANWDKINFGLGVFSCLNCHNHNLGDYQNENTTGLGSDPRPSCKKTNNYFDDGCGFVSDPFPDPDDPIGGGKPAYKTIVDINTDDLDYVGQEFVRDAINAYMKPTTETTLLTDPDTGEPVSITGLQTYTATPTPCAIRCARFSYERDVFPYDEKLITCKRKNYLILITDGQSTEVNGGHNIKACGNLMPWEMSDEAFTVTRDSLGALGNAEGAIRTFVIGLSTQITSGSARDELNQIAFYGRTDASDDSGGVEIAGDDPHWDVWDPTHNYAYFATNSRELAAALRRVVISIAAVDLAAGAPVTLSTESILAFDGDIVGLLPSAQFPESYGHLRLFNLEKVPTDPDYEIWDAGEELQARDLGAVPRAIYTSDPDSSPPHQLVALTPGDPESVAAFKRLAGAAALSDAEADELLDFLHGKPVSENPMDPGSPTHVRPWRLGDIVNSTPAVRGAPPRYVRFTSHDDFRALHAQRQTLVFVGASDLMLHAFDMIDGHELWGYVPPNLLPKVLEQHEQWKTDNYEFMGQPFASLDHIYGVAASPRLADIQDGAGNWLTALLSGEGPGGEAIFALDVTSTYAGRTIDGVDYPADHGYDALAPFEVMWFKSSEDVDFADLGESWSVPAVGYGAKAGESEFAWLAAFGSAYGSDEQGRYIHLVDALTGDLVSKRGNVALADRLDQIVTDNYFFADTVGYSTESTRADSPLTSEIQVDLAGQLWETQVTDSGHGHSLLFDVGDDQPLYFAPAVSTYRAQGPYSIFAYASGTYDESDRRVNGAAAVIEPKLYISLATTDGAVTETLSFAITDPTVMTRPDDSAFSPATRPVTSPLTLVPQKGPVRTLFTLFDPSPTTGDCFGRSYIAEMRYVPDPVQGTSVDLQVHEIGSGKVSGFAIGKNSIVVGQSGTGGEEAKIVPVTDANILPPIPSLEVIHWQELF